MEAALRALDSLSQANGVNQHAGLVPEIGNPPDTEAALRAPDSLSQVNGAAATPVKIAPKIAP